MENYHIGYVRDLTDAEFEEELKKFKKLRVEPFNFEKVTYLKNGQIDFNTFSTVSNRWLNSIAKQIKRLNLAYKWYGTYEEARDHFNDMAQLYEQHGSLDSEPQQAITNFLNDLYGTNHDRWYKNPTSKPLF